MPRQVGGFGWVRDLPDHRDLLFSVSLGTLRKLPSSVDLRSGCPPVYNQGRIGSCTANAIAAAIEFDRLKKRQLPDFVPSRLFIYYNERAIEGHTANDAGAQLRDGIKSVNAEGACPESHWPYDDSPAEFDGGPFPPGARAATKPSAACYTEALQYRAVNYQRLNQSLSQLKGCLAEGFPFVFGFTVFESFFKAPGIQHTVTPLPSADDSPVGGHAVMAVGFDDANRQFVVRNSWGASQADKGYFYMPYSYLTEHNLSSDFWVIQTMAG